MQILKDEVFNKKAENTLHTDLPEDTNILNGEGVDISSIFNTGWPVLEPQEDLIKLKKYKSANMLFSRNEITVDDLKVMVKFLAGQLAHDLYLTKLIEEDTKGAKFVITRTLPKTVFKEVDTKRSSVNIEVLAALELK